MTYDELREIALRYYSDTSRSATQTLEDLENLSDEIETWCAGLKSDIRNGDRQ
jgi:hypothetical protein